MSLPSGTITFLFTDIEGSTRLWDQFPGEMRTALARHDEILQAAIHDADGSVFKTVGDAFCAAFHTAPEALTAALNAQLALGRENWPDGIQMRVRMALHTGAAEIRGTDYFGQPLNRVARLLAVGHGGQVLLSDVSHQLCRDRLPPHAGLRPLGEHRLKDLGHPEHVYQLTYHGLRDDFPRLRSLEEASSNLPHQLSSFIGREKELQEVRRLLSESRLVTLTGAGGCGKTRLSLQVAADVLDSFEHGAWLVELAAISDPAIVPQAVAAVIGVKEEPGRPLIEALVAHLRERRLLLIMDNCEHLLDACASLAETVLHRCPNVVILATSREPLGISGDVNFRVPSLSAPDPKHASTPASLSLFESVRLFIERARFHLSSFAVTDQNAPALASICHRLDGIPLAIELAAARVRMMSLDEIDHRLDHSFALLTGGSRTNLPRQQTLRSLIDWSYQLLSPAEQRLLSRLSVFWGGWTLESAEDVCSSDGLERDDVMDLMSSLVDKSLVVPEEREGAMRYRLLETIRQFAAERLAEDDQAAVSARHLAYFHSLAVEHEPDFRGPKMQEWTARLESDNDNFRAALRWSIEDGHDLQSGLETAASIWRFWYHRGHFAEGLRWLAEVERPEATALPLAIQAKALNGAGVMAWNGGDYPRARGFHEKTLAIHRELGDRRGIAISLNNLGLVVFDQGEYELAQSLYGQSVAILKELGDRYGVASLLNSQGTCAFYYGSLEEACALLEESIAVKREIGDKHGIVMSLGNLALATKERGQLDRARALLSEVTELNRELGDHTSLHTCQEVLGDIAIEDGDLKGAAAFLAEALQVATADGMPFRTATTLESYASLAVALNRIREAALLWGYAAKVREDMGTAQSPPVKRYQDRRVASAREACDDDAQFDAWWREGGTLSRDQAVALAKELA